MLMKFYKIVNGKNFVGVATTNDLRTVQKKYAMLISCLESEAQYVQVGNDLYHANWMRNIKGNEDIMADLVDVIEISQEEYDEISSTIEKGEVYEKPIDEINADDDNNENDNNDNCNECAYNCNNNCNNKSNCCCHNRNRCCNRKCRR